MTKRRLSKQQKWRIKKIQDERSQRAARKESKQQELLESGDLGPPQLGRVIAHFGQQLEVEPIPTPKTETRFRCYVRANINGLVTGDRVVWREGKQNTGVIEAQEPRQSVLKRPDRFNQLKPVAANIDHIFIVIAPEPTPFANLINRYLVACEAMQIKPRIILNKQDLLNDNNKESISRLRDLYQSLEYDWIEVSSKSNHGLDPLNDLLRERTSVFVGQSGVGKSSLIGALLPEEDIKIGDLSEVTRKGMHTTTTARLFHMPIGGDLIDSPGIREFGLWHMDEKTLAEGFIEFRPFLGHCRFRDCQHRHEPGCALQTALEEGKITKERLDSFYHIRASLAEHDGYQ